VWVAQSRQRSELALEAPASSPGNGSLHELEGDVSSVARIARAIDDTHAPLAELGTDLEPLVPQFGDGVLSGRGVVRIGGRLGRQDNKGFTSGD
jgi:hypothetical protein